MPHFPQSNLHQNIISQFGRETLGLFRYLERKTHQQAKWANHVHFNVHCRHHHVAPRSIHIQKNVKGAKADSFLQKAEQALLAERIHQCIIKNNETSHIVEKEKRQMQAATNDATYKAIQGHMQRTYQTSFNRAQNQQQN
jgi:DNA primase